MQTISLFHPRCRTFYVILTQGSDGCSLTMKSEENDAVLNVGSTHCVGYNDELARLKKMGYLKR